MFKHKAVFFSCLWALCLVRSFHSEVGFVQEIFSQPDLHSLFKTSAVLAGYFDRLGAQLCLRDTHGNKLMICSRKALSKYGYTIISASPMRGDFFGE